MSLLTHVQLAAAIIERAALITGAPEGVDPHNGSSLKVHLGPRFWREVPDPKVKKDEVAVLSLREHDPMTLKEGSLEDGAVLMPGEFAQFESLEQFNVPSTMTGVFVLRSRVGRMGINQMQSVVLQPGWSGHLVLELHNVSQFHAAQLSAGDEVGQVLFFGHQAVPSRYLYDGPY